jgi:hypothetical protein
VGGRRIDGERIWRRRISGMNIGGRRINSSRREHFRFDLRGDVSDKAMNTRKEDGMPLVLRGE